MVTAVSTIANGGAHVTPRVVKQIVYKNTGEVKDIEIKKEEGVISLVQLKATRSKEVQQ